MIYPKNKKFAFTIIDDTEGDEVTNTKPVYDFLSSLGFKTTKTVWCLPPKDSFKGLSLSDYHYRQYIKKLQRDGFEIALHNVGSGRFTRQDVLDGLEIFRQFIGKYPEIQINHALNPDNIYWGIKRFFLLKPLWRWDRFKGDNAESIYFWGDYHKKHIKFTRNFTFDSLITTKEDSYMPYREKGKEFANYWFSASNGPDISKFNKLVNQANIDRLILEGGVAIVYTHFAQGFTKGGHLDRTFQKNMTYLARQNGWFVPSGEILNYLLEKRGGEIISSGQKFGLELKWLLDKCACSSADPVKFLTVESIP
ncbi:MAG: hypothetical protein HW405_841 [Candidatus Berkelbacteria bacterium]|nr:hypothetical protein [Candidatus Berkelbacteria bacterium]